MPKDIYAPYRILLRDWGYKLEGRRLIRRAIRGFTSDELVNGLFDSPLEACEHLIPIIYDDSFYRELQQIHRRNSGDDSVAAWRQGGPCSPLVETNRHGN